MKVYQPLPPNTPIVNNVPMNHVGTQTYLDGTTVSKLVDNVNSLGDSLGKEDMKDITNSVDK